MRGGVGVSREQVGLSKFLSYVLRHRPDEIGLELDAGGWASVDELLERAADHGRAISRDALEAVVASNDKRRFRLSDDGRRIRASQGHSIPVDLGLEPREPPATLFHGTAARFLDAIRVEGLRPAARHHVHLSTDPETARAVGARHGSPVILLVDGAAMQRDGHVFFRSENGVWLTDHVPPRYLTVHR